MQDETGYSPGPYVAVRVFRDPEADEVGEGAWSIDLVDAQGDYSEACRTHLDEDHRLGRAQALEHAPLFAAEHGAVGVPVQVCDD